MRVSTALRKINELKKDNQNIENFTCWCAYNSIDYVIEDIAKVSINFDWIHFEQNKTIDYKNRLTVKELVKFLKQYNTKRKEIVANDSRFELKEITIKNNDLYFVFKDRFEK